MKKFNSRIRAFTLIELIIVIAIIAILTGIVLSSLNGAKMRSRDAKRIADIGQIQLALEQFFDRCQEYPTSYAIGTACPSNSTVTMGNFISKIPTPPTGSYSYAYRNDKLDYVLKTTLEANNDAIKDAYSAFPSGTYTGSFTCTPASYDYCVGPK